MQDLVVCVGETCHQSGAEHVLKCFIDLIASNKLESEICLKGSFCIGGGCEQDEVSVRLDDRRFQVTVDQAADIFAREVFPATTTITED